MSSRRDWPDDSYLSSYQSLYLYYTIWLNIYWYSWYASSFWKHKTLLLNSKSGKDIQIGTLLYFWASWRSVYGIKVVQLNHILTLFIQIWSLNLISKTIAQLSYNLYPSNRTAMTIKIEYTWYQSMRSTKSHTVRRYQLSLDLTRTTLVSTPSTMFR